MKYTMPGENSFSNKEPWVDERAVDFLEYQLCSFSQQMWHLLYPSPNTAICYHSSAKGYLKENHESTP